MSIQPQFTGFDPWVGKHYYDQPFLGKRILIVRGPFVVRKRTRTTLTTDPAQSIKEVNGGHVDHLLPVLKGVPRNQTSASQRQKLWESVSYFDYHQCSCTSLVAEDLPGVLPMFKDRFQKVLGQLRPEIIAVRGSFFTGDHVLIGATHLERVEFLCMFAMPRRSVLMRFQYPNGSAMAFTLGGFFNDRIWNEMIRLAVRRSS
jgi:hypothetical protein